MSAHASQPIYLDHNATTPVLPEVVEAMRACYAEPSLNPASQHEFGRRARRRLEEARERILELVGGKTTGSDADRLIFTSGGTEANNLAIRGLLIRAGGAYVESPGPEFLTTHILISAAEHPSISSLAKELQRCGHEFDEIPLSKNGTVRVDSLRHLQRPNTSLVAVILGQNETGVLQPVADVASKCGVHGIPVHTDAAQVVGKLPVDFRALGVATMTIAAHKFHGPLGIGALAVRHGVELRPQLFGGFQQGATRPGTESVALAVGMCRALELWHAERESRCARIRALRDQFEREIVAGWPEALVLGAGAERLPTTSNIAMVGLDRQALFLALDQAGVACSTGSACASGSSEPSPALVAMGCGKAVIESALRFSFGATTTAEEVAEATRRILRCCNTLRRPKDH